MTAEAEIEEGAVAPVKKSKTKLIIIAAAAVLVLAVGGGAFMFLSGGKQAEEAAHAVQVPTSFVFNLPTMTVNLNSEGGEQSFMRLSIALEVADQEVMTAIQPKMAKVIDAFQVYLRELRRSDLEGSAGIYRLKEELLRRVNLAIAPASIDSVLFKEILVQ
jgi:flagellar FliL protein